MRLRLGPIALLLASASFLDGCHGEASASPASSTGAALNTEGDVQRQLVAIDTSGSARQSFPMFERQVRDINDALPNGSTLEIYRFDTGVNEIYVGGPLGAKEFKQKLRAGLASHREERGTSLLRMVQRIDDRLQNAPVAVTILTDCGIEGMTKRDHGLMQGIAQKWAGAHLVRSLRFVGVRPMHHDALRRDFAPLEGRMTIE